MTTKTAGRTAGPLTGSTGQATKTPRAGVAQLVERQLPNVTHGSGDPSDTGISCEDSLGRCTASHRGKSPAATQTADRTAGTIREPVLFLDIDGVLNSAEWMRAGHMSMRSESWAEMLCPEMCARLERVLSTTGAVIVLSTSWRIVQPADRIEAWLRERGAPSARIIDRTPGHRELPSGVRLLGNKGRRGHEIQAWLNRHPCERFAVVDDETIHGADPHELLDVVSRFVQTSWAEGMQDEHAEELIAMLSEAPDA